MSDSSFKVISSDDVDLKKWERILENTNSSYSQYCEHWYINSICKKWKVIVKDDYSSAFPFAVALKGGISLVYQPFFSRQFTFLGNYDSEFVSFVFSFLSTNFKWIRINLPFSFKNSEASISKRRFQQLDLSGSYQSISANYSTNAKRILKKSLGFSMKKCEDIEIFTNFFKKHVGDRIGLKKSNYTHFSALIKNGLNNQRFQLFSIHLNDEIQGYVCFYFHKNIINYFKGALNENGKKSGAMFFAFDQLIQQNTSKGCIFDFGGSNVDSIANFNKKFGAQDKFYYSYEHNTLSKAVQKVIEVKNKFS